MKTALITHPDCLTHDTPTGHPEQVARLERVLQALEGADVTLLDAPLATDNDLTRVHPASYINGLRDQTPLEGRTQLDDDTWMSPNSMAAALRAAGGCLYAVDLVLGGAAPNAFCATRPPGHHAETQRPMGFCLFGNVAMAAKYALDHHGLQRVAVVDFDVHHGNGTQDLLKSEPRCLTITSQQNPLWPGTGFAEETGDHNNILNLPLPPNSDGADMQRAYSDIVFPRLIDFAPQLILISAGFDAHRNDPLAQLNWETSDFAWLTNQICKIAADICDGRVVSVLEGGYDLDALAASARAHVDELIKAAGAK
jgi:acetoin utilization deacetylase AcuC-like enzyme